MRSLPLPAERAKTSAPALPISTSSPGPPSNVCLPLPPEMILSSPLPDAWRPLPVTVGFSMLSGRSEERRVGKECVSTCRSRWCPEHYKKTNQHENVRAQAQQLQDA